MLLYILYGLFVLACLVLILAVLLQPGKADAGALFTSSVSSTAFGPRGTQTLLAKITIAAAAVFMLTALMLALGVGRSRSVMESGVSDPAAPAPAASPATPGANASPGNTTAPAANNNAAPNSGGANANAAPANSAANTSAPADTSDKPQNQQPSQDAKQPAGQKKP